ncbi:hypothetical protein HWV54_00315 [Bartonella alsatica]|uniref:Uncharacterized protein n=1 Tax=Bartonella alsatica TaxID=52764 RepID=A0ABX6QEI2_9HYPH|nr:hypothetical protein [Bartonella alsatica]QLC51436.1 hypothetical protein HWV54_00315 [Bartonella alsatica]
MTVYNALNSLEQQGMRNIAGNININLYAPASNAAAVADKLNRLNNGKQTTVGFDGHRYDFVSRWIGGNDFTYQTVPAASNS